MIPTCHCGQMSPFILLFEIQKENIQVIPWASDFVASIRVAEINGSILPVTQNVLKKQEK